MNIQNNSVYIFVTTFMYSVMCIAVTIIVMNISVVQLRNMYHNIILPLNTYLSEYTSYGNVITQKLQHQIQRPQNQTQRSHNPQPHNPHINNNQLEWSIPPPQHPRLHQPFDVNPQIVSNNIQQYPQSNYSNFNQPQTQSNNLGFYIDFEENEKIKNEKKNEHTVVHNYNNYNYDYGGGSGGNMYFSQRN